MGGGHQNSLMDLQGKVSYNDFLRATGREL
jgi:hypothetical protein